MKIGLLLLAFTSLLSTSRLPLKKTGTLNAVHHKAAAADGSFSAKINGKLYTGKNNHATLTINYAKMGVNIFTVESFSTTDAMAAKNTPHFIFSLHFTGSVPQKGSFVFQDVDFKKPFDANHGFYDRGWDVNKDTGNPTESSYKFAPAKGGIGSLVITVINANAVSGTFSGTAVNSKGEKLTITDGLFTNLVIH